MAIRRPRTPSCGRSSLGSPSSTPRQALLPRPRLQRPLLLVLLGETALLALERAPIAGEVAAGGDALHREGEPAWRLGAVEVDATLGEEVADVGHRLEHREGAEEGDGLALQRHPGADDE